MVTVAVEVDHSFQSESGDVPIIESSSSIRHSRHCYIGSVVTIHITSQSTGIMSSSQLIQNESPVESSDATLDAVGNGDGYASVQIKDDVWNLRLQDKGSTKEMMPAKTYERSQIPPIGPEGYQTYYYDLTSIAIDILSNMKMENELGRGWSKVPKNRTDAKIKLVQVILRTRKLHNNEYHLEQSKVLDMCSTMWGAARPVNILHHNDRVRVFGILMTIPENRDKFERLANGPKGRNQIDDIGYHPKQIFQDTALGFNNESIKIELPRDAYDLHNIEDIDPNDIGRIRITRNCELYILF